MMKVTKSNHAQEIGQALNALKLAILEGATWRYEHLVDLAQAAGATERDIDIVAHEAVEALFARAEQPVTAQRLAHLCHTTHHR